MFKKFNGLYFTQTSAFWREKYQKMEQIDSIKQHRQFYEISEWAWWWLPMTFIMIGSFVTTKSRGIVFSHKKMDVIMIPNYLQTKETNVKINTRERRPDNRNDNNRCSDKKRHDEKFTLRQERDHSMGGTSKQSESHNGHAAARRQRSTVGPIARWAEKRPTQGPSSSNRWSVGHKRVLRNPKHRQKVVVKKPGNLKPRQKEIRLSTEWFFSVLKHDPRNFFIRCASAVKSVWKKSTSIKIRNPGGVRVSDRPVNAEAEALLGPLGLVGFVQRTVTAMAKSADECGGRGSMKKARNTTGDTYRQETWGKGQRRGEEGGKTCLVWLLLQKYIVKMEPSIATGNTTDIYAVHKSKILLH